MKKYFDQFLFGTSLNDNNLLNIGWLFFRVQIGLSIAIHAGLPKLENGLAPGWFVNQVSGLGFNFPSPSFWAAVAVWGEFVGGILIVLGLFTRFSAFQLAFQFFVISFLWYDNPEPFTGMYFQHSLFWGFVLAVFLGGGKFSIDKLIMNRKKMNIPAPARIVVTSCLILFLVSTSQAQQANRILIDDFDNAKGNWMGTITYLDYSSGKPFSMPANVSISGNKLDKRQLILAFQYPDEPKANGNDTLIISADGKMINDAIVVSSKTIIDLRVIIADKNGTDGNENKKAILRHIYTIGKKTFIMRKEVKFDGEDKWIMRNEYKMSR